MSEKLVIHLDKDDTVQQQAFSFAYALSKHAEQTDAFVCDFWNRLFANKAVYEEFVYFMQHADYLCKAKIENVSVVDIMVWQMDRFKAELDQDKSLSKQNGDYMLLMAFDTFLSMYEDPSPILKAMASDTGTDYLGKYQSWS